MGKPVRIICPSEGPATFDYQGSNGTTALTLAGSSANNGGTGIENCNLTGPGSGTATTGLQVGYKAGPVGTSGALFKNVTINGFGTGLSILSIPAGSVSYLNTFIDSHIEFNNVGVSLSGEENQFFGGLIGSNIIGVSIAQQSSDSLFAGLSFDDNITNAIRMTQAGAVLTFVGCHFENPSLTTSVHYIADSADDSSLSIYGGYMEERNTVGGPTAQFISVSGSRGFVGIWGLTADSKGRTVTQAVNLSGSAYGTLALNLRSASVSNVYNSTYAGGPVTISPNSTSGNLIHRYAVAGEAEAAQEWFANNNGSRNDIVCGIGIDADNEFACRDLISSNDFYRYLTAASGSEQHTWWIGGEVKATVNSSGLAVGAGSPMSSTGAGGVMGAVIASGTATMTTAPIHARSCGTTVTIAAANVRTTDTVTWAFKARPSGTNAGLVAWPKDNSVNFAYCPGVTETPAPATINWRVIR